MWINCDTTYFILRGNSIILMGQNMVQLSKKKLWHYTFSKYEHEVVYSETDSRQLVQVVCWDWIDLNTCL